MPLVTLGFGIWGFAEHVMVYIGETVNLAYFGVPVLVGEIGWIFMVWLYMRKGVEEMERRREGEVGGVLDSWNES